MIHHNNKGETIVETLAAILIVSVCFLMIQNSVVTAARINESSRENNSPFYISDTNEKTSCEITIDRGGSATSNSTYSGTCYKAGSYWYYE